jgi:hypothetical protein
LRVLRIFVVYLKILSVTQVLQCQKVLRRIFVLREEESTAA